MVRRGERLGFTAKRRCILAHHRFNEGDGVIVTLRADWDMQGPDFRKGGPWGWGDYTGRCLRRIASIIQIADTGEVIF